MTLSYLTETAGIRVFAGGSIFYGNEFKEFVVLV
jgi:hypothetical protein